MFKNMLGAAISFFLLVTVSIGMFSNGTVDLKKSGQLKGRVIYAEIIDRPSKVGTQKIFAFKIQNHNQTLGTYRPAQVYSRLVQAIKIGDTITVYYNSNNSDALNIDVYQIEKNGVVIQDYESFKQNFWLLGLLIGAAAIAFLTYIFWILKKTDPTKRAGFIKKRSEYLKTPD